MRKAVLSICVIVRDEALYIGEWIHFCRLTGVERFYIYLDYPRDDTEKILRELNQEDIVFINWTEDQYRSNHCPERCTFRSTPQITAFNHWIKTYAGETKWVMFIDPDEYVYHVQHDDLRIALSEVPDSVSAIWVQWLIFGRNGHVTKPEGLTIMNYTRRGLVGKPIPYGCHGKIIAKSDRLAYFGPHGSHNAIFKTGGTINEYGLPVTKGGFPAYTIPERVVRLIRRMLKRKMDYQEATADFWRCNHYYNRSEEEALSKLARGDRNAVGKYIPDRRRIDVHDVNDIEDRNIWRFLPGLQKTLGIEVTAPEETRGAQAINSGLALTQLLSIEIGRECNLAKAHCGKCPSYDSNRYGRLDTTRALSDDDIFDCVCEAYRLGFRGQVAFHYYNEPMLYWGRIKTIIGRVNSLRPEAQFCLWTNGTVLPENLGELSVFSSIWVSNYANREWQVLLKPHVEDVNVESGILDARKSQLTRAEPKRCVRPFNEIIVDTYGNGHFCCADWRGEIHLGNVHAEGFRTIVGNFLKLREIVAEKPFSEEYPAYCKLCPLKMRKIFTIVPSVAQNACNYLKQT